jgi:hypothetical protein
MVLETGKSKSMVLGSSEGFLLHHNMEEGITDVLESKRGLNSLL